MGVGSDFSEGDDVKDRQWLHEIEKRALTGDREAVLQLVGISRWWLEFGDRMLEQNVTWCEPLRQYAANIAWVEEEFGS